MRLAPKSLFGRFVLVLLAGLALSQLATLYINQTERDRLLYRAGGMRLAQQISDIVKLLDSLPGAERRRVVAVFNRPPLAVSLDQPRSPCLQTKRTRISSSRSLPRCCAMRSARTRRSRWTRRWRWAGRIGLTNMARGASGRAGAASVRRPSPCRSPCTTARW